MHSQFDDPDPEDDHNFDPDPDPEYDHNYNPDPDPDLEHADQESEVQMPEEEAFTVLVRIMQEYRFFSPSSSSS